MEKEKARQLLQDYIDKQIANFGTFKLPIVDVVVLGEIEHNAINCYTWRYLVSVAYSLNP
jgi:purine-cytosine permease-like protein